jgi:poly [ADP-ribose] polymerase
VAKNSKKIQEAEKANVPVVSEDYLEAVETEPALAAILKHNLVSWGKKKFTAVEKKGKRSAVDATDGPSRKKKEASSAGKVCVFQSMFEKRLSKGVFKPSLHSLASGKVVEKKVKMSVKGGAVVDPDSGIIQYSIIPTCYPSWSLILLSFTPCPPSKKILSVLQSFSGLEDVAHVLEVKGEVYNAVLGMVDITRGTNSYYKLQVLKEDKSEQFVFPRFY